MSWGKFESLDSIHSSLSVFSFSKQLDLKAVKSRKINKNEIF